MPNPQLEKAVQSLKPTAVLDVGCGCGGHSTTTMAGHCARVVAIDIAPRIPRWQDIARSSKVSFCCMDALVLGFAGGSFPLVVETATLHHIAHWPEALAEMIRVSSSRIFLEEPVDDLRSAAKQRTYEAQGLFLALQAEVGFPHYRHLERDALMSVLESRAVVVETQLEKSDTPITFDEFFESFGEFASQSSREGYWLDQLQELRTRFGGSPLCEDDTLTILATKDKSRCTP